MSETISEVLARTAKPILVQSQADDGTWYDHFFANDGAAVEYEQKWNKRGVNTRRTT